LRNKLNNQILGFIAGIVLPVITFLCIYLTLSGSLNLVEYVEKIVTFNVLTKFLSLSVLPNLLLFFISMWKNYLVAGRGILAATIVDAFIVLLIKVII